MCRVKVTELLHELSTFPKLAKLLLQDCSELAYCNLSHYPSLTDVKVK
jgi:hypothetical protein